MKRWGTLALCCLLLTGCASVAREPDQLALVRVLGVDGGTPVTLTAVCAREDSEKSCGCAEGLTFEQARRALPWSGMEVELSLTGVSYLLIGPDTELDQLLFSVLEDADLGASATVWLAEEGAQAALSACEDPLTDLERLTLQRIGAPTVAQALAALSAAGTIALPCLKVQEGRLTERGMRQWQKSS